MHNDTDKCDACNICAKNCPVDCIYIETEGKGKDRYMTRYAIDFNKCIWCSLCTENCHTGSITMSHDYDHAVYLRDSLVYEFMIRASASCPATAKPASRRVSGWSPRKRNPSGRLNPPADEKPADPEGESK